MKNEGTNQVAWQVYEALKAAGCDIGNASVPIIKRKLAEFRGEVEEGEAQDGHVLIKVTVDARDALHTLVSEPELGDTTYSTFILRAVDAARRQMEEHRAYVERRRRLVRLLNENLSDEEADALLAKLDAEESEPPADHT